jgi:signal transduction histidine kinase
MNSEKDGSGTANETVPGEGRSARQIGHDLNNCLGVVGGRAELARLHIERGNLDGARKGLEVILGQIERMKELTDALRGVEARGGETPAG